MRDRILFGSRVEKVEKKTDGMWTISTQDSHTGRREFRSSRIVIATGLTSLPNIPTFLLRQKTFGGPICHHKDFGEVSKSLFNTPGCKNVVVLGGGKSATDMVYESVKKGKSVSWIIRKRRRGSSSLLPCPWWRSLREVDRKGCDKIECHLQPILIYANPLIS